MDLKEYLFDGGNTDKPAVKFCYWLGGGCGFCAVLRFFLLSLVLSAWLAFGIFTAGIVAFAISLFFLELKKYAADYEYPPLDPDEPDPPAFN